MMQNHRLFAIVGFARSRMVPVLLELDLDLDLEQDVEGETERSLQPDVDRDLERDLEVDLLMLISLKWLVRLTASPVIEDERDPDGNGG